MKDYKKRKNPRVMRTSILEGMIASGKTDMVLAILTKYEMNLHEKASGRFGLHWKR